MLTIRHDRATVVHLILATTAWGSMSAADFHFTSWGVRISIALGTLILVAALIIVRVERKRTLRRNNPEFGRFFSEWYNQVGRLMVYCNDLDWIPEKAIVPLYAKAGMGQLRLYLSNVGNLAKDLKSKGAELYHIQATGVPAHSFSILESDGTERIIYRLKSVGTSAPGSETIEFIYADGAQDPYIVALAKDVLTPCRKEP